ncbi:MAG: MFS transporter [Alphaproteobacteria bacterium]|nr:MFS transporter [Alphaproteobacteria bacterium]
MTLYRNVASLVLAIMLLQGASGILNVTTPLALDFMGASSLGVGLVWSMFYAGYMLGAWFSPDAVRSVGHIRAYSAAAAIYCAGILSMALVFQPVGWAVLRLAQGAASAVMFTAAESWIADSTPREKRGGVMGMYQVLIKLALSGGPLLVADHAPGDLKPYIWAGILMTLSAAPLCATRRAQPVLPDKTGFSVGKLFAIPPTALAAAAVAGLANSGVTSQLPLYAKALHPEGAQLAATVITIAVWTGGTVTQWPAGLVSDRFDRRLVVAALGAVASGASIALYLGSRHFSWPLVIALGAVWGGGALSFYSVAAAHATDRCEPGQIAQVLSGMLFVWAAGSVIGPVLTGLAADSSLGQPGIFLVVSGAYFALTAINLWRAIVTDRPGRAQRTPYLPVAGLSVVEGAIAEQEPQVTEDAGMPAQPV